MKLCIPFLVIPFFFNFISGNLEGGNVTLNTTISRQNISESLTIDKQKVVVDSILSITFTYSPTNNNNNDSLSSKILDENLSLQWIFNNQTISNVLNGTEEQISENTYFTDKINYDKQERKLTLIIPRPSAKNIGVYDLRITLPSNDEILFAQSTVMAPPIFNSFEKTKRALEGDSIIIFCELHSNPPVNSILWESISNSFPLENNNKNVTFYQNNSRISFKSRLFVNDTLYISPVEATDSGYFLCKASNEFGSDTVALELQVKDRLAALWPFLAIVFEVTVVVLLILTYEKRRTNQFEKKTAEEKERLKEMTENNCREENVDESSHLHQSAKA